MLTRTDCRALLESASTGYLCVASETSIGVVTALLTAVVHSRRAHPSCTPVVHTRRAHPSCTPVVHSRRAHPSCTPVVPASVRAFAGEAARAGRDGRGGSGRADAPPGVDPGRQVADMIAPGGPGHQPQPAEERSGGAEGPGQERRAEAARRQPQARVDELEVMAGAERARPEIDVLEDPLGLERLARPDGDLLDRDRARKTERARDRQRAGRPFAVEPRRRRDVGAARIEAHPDGRATPVSPDEVERLRRRQLVNQLAAGGEVLDDPEPPEHAGLARDRRSQEVEPRLGTRLQAHERTAQPVGRSAHDGGSFWPSPPSPPVPPPLDEYSSSLRYSVLRSSPSRCAARVLLPPSAASTRRMYSRSSSSSVRSARQRRAQHVGLRARRLAHAVERQSRRRARSRPRHSATARSTTFSSSRTLPGQP